jgi:hypothetical protein
VVTGKSFSKIFSILLVVIFMHTGVLPAQTATAAASNTADLPANLSVGDWAQIKALLPPFAAAITYTQQAYLKASTARTGDGFGYAMSLDGNTLVVGAEYECSNATGVMYSGAAYVFTRTAEVWSQQAYLKASNAEDYDNFGDAVSLSGDTLVVGAGGEDSNATGVNGDQADNSAVDSGAAYVFTRSGTTWSQQAYLKASNTDEGDNFAWVSLSGDTLVVGAHGEDSNASGVNGNQVNNLAYLSGAAYVFTRTAGVWSQQAYLKASNTEMRDEFGHAVSLSGNMLVVGATGEDSNATVVNGNQANNSASQSGAAYVFTRTAGVWSQQAYLKASNTGAGDFFGSSMSASGDTLAIGADGESSNAIGVNGDQADNSASQSGAAYVFTRTAGVWSQQAYLKASNTEVDDNFGSSMSVSGDTLVVGAIGEDSNAIGVNGDQADNSASQSGAAYVFTRSGTTWSQQAYLKASNTDEGDNFAWVSLSGDTLVVGADGEDSDATDVNGDGANNLAENSGAAYVFSLTTVHNLFLPFILR